MHVPGLVIDDDPLIARMSTTSSTSRTDSASRRASRDQTFGGHQRMTPRRVVH
jgi:hypothetical protein